jgi:hypothetical protein
VPAAVKDTQKQPGRGAAGVTWSALRDDYPLEKAKGKNGGVALKNWDRDDSDDEGGGGGKNGSGGNDEGEGGLRMTAVHDRKASGAASKKAK